MHILLLYIARTSSSYIWQLFKGIKDVKVYGEIMNGPEKYLRPLGAKDKINDLRDDEDQSYREFAKKKFPEYLKFLENYTKEPFFFTKVSLIHIFGLIDFLRRKSNGLGSLVDFKPCKRLSWGLVFGC